MSELTQQYEAFANRVEGFRRDVNPEAALSAVDRGVAAFAGELTHKGVSVAPEGVLERVRRVEADEYDGQLRARGLELDREEREIWRVVEAELAAAAECAPDPALDVKNDSVRLMAELLRNQQRDAAERSLTGKTLSYVLREYMNTPDTANPERIRLIEQQVARGWSEIPLQASPDDAEALAALRRQISNRRAARTQERAPDALAVAAKLTAIRRSASVDILRRHIRDGRRVAGPPRPRKLAIQPSV
jgi:hypothetical protein